MPTFRYYLIDDNCTIVTADFLSCDDLNAAIIGVHEATRTGFGERVRGFEIWQDAHLMHRELWE